MEKKRIIDHELIHLLRSFTKEEIKKFGLYLRSPYFSRRKSLFIFYKALIKYHPLYTHIRLTKEMLYRKVYRAGQYKDVSVRDLFNETVKAAKNFLALKSFETDDLYSIHVLRQLRLRNQHRLFSNQVKKINSAINNYGGIDSSYFYLKFHFDAEKYNENVIHQKLNSAKIFIQQAGEISSSGINLMIYTILEIISGYINLLIREDKSRIPQVDKFMLGVVNNLALKKMYDNIKGKSRYDYIIEMYDLLLKALIRRGNWTAYNDFKTSVLNNLNKIRHDEISELYSNMIKISILGTRAGEYQSEFNNELLELYNTFLSRKYFRLEKSMYIPADLYRAIIFHAVKMNNISLLKTLVNESKPWLSPDSKNSLINYARSYYFHAIRDYNSALDSINKVKTEYYLLKYDLYILKLKVFFESGEYELALDLILAFRKFISNDKLMQDERKVKYRGFANFLEKIIRISTNSTNIDADTLLLKFQKSKNVISSEWILEKIQNLQKKIPAYSRSV